MERFSALCALAKKIIKEVTEVDDATDKSNEKSLKEHIRKELENEFDVKSLSKPKSCGRIRKKATFDSLSSAQKDMVIEVLSHGIAKIKEIMTACGKEKWFNKVLKKPSSRTPGGETEKSFTKFIRDAHFSLLCLQFIWLSVQDRQHPASPGDKKVVLWVDDNPENNADEVKEGEEKHEINVTQVVSTKDAKQFLSKNGSLKGKPTRSFRVITDIYREDEGPKAAENLIKYMRDNGWTKVPILVYCSKNEAGIELQMKYSNVLLATKINQIMLYFELMDAKTQELSFKKVAEGGSGGDDDDETEEEEEETEDEEEAKKSHPPPPPPPPKTMKVKCEDDEMPIGFEGAPPPPPPIPSKMTEAKSIDDEMPIGFEGAPLPPSSDVYRAPTLEGDKMVIDTDISGVNLDFLGSKPPPAKKAKTRVPAQINMTVSSPTAIAGQYNVVTIKLEGQMLPDTIAPVWGNHSLLWRHEPSGAKGRFALSTLRADGLGRTDVEVNMSLLDGLPNAKGTIEVRLDSEDSPKCVTVRVVPDVLDQKATTFKVLQGAEGVRAGEPVKVAVFPKDKYSNEGASVEGNDVLVIAQGKEEVKGVYCGDSERLEYTMTFRASGKYKLFVSCNRAMISGAPMDLVVAPGHLVKIEVKDLTRGHKVGCGGVSAAAAVLPNFRVTGQDGCGNAVKCNPAEVGMVLYAKRDPSKAGRVENQKVELNSVTGNVIVRNATVAPYPRLYGEYVLRVFAGAAEELVPVEFLPPELDLVQCFIERPICVKLGELCRAVVTLRDTAGGPYTGPVRELRLECRTPQCSCEGVLNQNKDKATFTFFPTRAQHWDVSVKYAGKDITGSPFKLDVVKPCDLKPVVPDLPATTTGLAGVPVALMPPPAMTTPSTSPKKTGAATPGPSCDDDIQTLPF